jgi:mono/diheme cytochrome c family protein
MWRQVLSKRLLLGLAGIGAVCVVALLAFAWRPAIAPIDPPAPSSFPRELVAKGEILASAGDCGTCHTSNPVQPYAGGYAFSTPFGVVHSTNITPDPETGIGRWSEAAFTRAMREGVARDGSQLFPAFPFDHFTKLSDDDIKAIYAYLMTVPPAKAAAMPNRLSFPANVRALQAAWKMLYLHEGPYRPNPAKSAEWNRGAYLAEGIAHCGACHTRRNVFGAEQVGHPYGGEFLQGWIAWPLDVSPSPARWTKDDYVTYLRGGTTVHGRATGPMGSVVKGLAKLPDSDIQAIATYFVELDRPPRPNADAAVAKALAAATPKNGLDRERGARLYVAACGSCHDHVGPGRAELALSSALWYDYPYSFLRAVLNGIGSEQDAPGPMMPAFRDIMNDADITAIGNYLRRTRTGQGDWSESENWAAKVRADPQAVPWAR